MLWEHTEQGRSEMATITDRDMTYFVQEALMQDAPDSNVAAIVDELKGRFGLVDLDKVPSADFWATVEKHAIPEPETESAPQGGECGCTDPYCQA